MDRPFLSLSILQLEEIYKQSLVNKEHVVLKVLLNELSFRSSKRSKSLYEQILNHKKEKSFESSPPSQLDILKLRIQRSNFGETLTMWHNFAENLSRNPELILEIKKRWDLIYLHWKSVKNDFFDEYSAENYYPEHGILSLFDYTVKNNKVLRRVILVELLRAHIPPISNYYEWGLPGTKERKEKMRLTLSGLAFPRRNQKKLEGAVKAWDSDLEFIVKFFD